MVSSGRHAIVYTLLLLSTVVSAQSQSAVDKGATSTITGKVTVGGKGISGVVVGLMLVASPSRHLPTRFRGISDEDGNYRITNVQPGSYEVIAVAPAYVATEGRKSVIVGRNEVIENIDITLLRGGVITGKVTDADGNPVIEERIQLSQASSGQSVFYNRSSIFTDDRGIYRAFGVPAGRYKISAGTDGESLSSRGSTAAHQRTYYPSVTQAAEATVIEVSEGSEATNVDITLGRELRRYSAHGRVVDADTSKPMPAMRVSVQLFFQNGSTSVTAAESDKDGEFNIQNLYPGKYSVFVGSINDSEWHAEPVRFEVVDQDVDGLLLKTSRGASAWGVIILEGTNDPKVRANLARGRVFGNVANNNPGRNSHSASINPDGSFALNGLPAGRLMLQLQTPDKLIVTRLEHNGVAYPRGVEIKEREVLTGLRVVASHANGTIRGVLKLPEGLVLPQGSRFMLGLRRSEDPPFTYYGAPIQTDARGHFLIEGLIPGTYEIVLAGLVNARPERQPSIQRTTHTVVVTGGVTEVTITLQTDNR
jgi:protocatechuate 3,4-dioxygenase beta subunit